MNQNFFTAVGTLKEPKDFEGGNEKQRNHLNDLVAIERVIIKEARKAMGNFDFTGYTPEQFYVTKNGERVLCNIPCQFLQE